MRVVVVTPPDPVVDLEQTKDHLNVDHDDDDALITAYIAAATANLDGPGGWLGRALGVQTLEARLDAFDLVRDDFALVRDPLLAGAMFRRFEPRHWIGDTILLPCPPHIEIESVKYVDVNGAEQIVDPGDYELLGAELDVTYGKTWPMVRRQREAVRIRYTAGYETLHPSIYAAILLMVGDLYANRETVLADSRAAAVEIPMSTTVENLLAPLRVWA